MPTTEEKLTKVVAFYPKPPILIFWSNNLNYKTTLDIKIQEYWWRGHDVLDMVKKITSLSVDSDGILQGNSICTRLDIITSEYNQALQTRQILLWLYKVSSQWLFQTPWNNSLDNVYFNPSAKVKDWWKYKIAYKLRQ